MSNLCQFMHLCIVQSLPTTHPNLTLSTKLFDLEQKSIYRLGSSGLTLAPFSSIALLDPKPNP